MICAAQVLAWPSEQPESFSRHDLSACFVSVWASACANLRTRKWRTAFSSENSLIASTATVGCEPVHLPGLRASALRALRRAHLRAGMRALSFLLRRRWLVGRGSHHVRFERRLLRSLMDI